MNKKSIWMHPRKHVSNNIEYRIATANALASFKRDQGFIMGQVAHNPHHKFSRLAKEIMLLKYDVWYDYLNEVEQYILCNYDKDILELVSGAIKMGDKRVIYYKETLEDNFLRKEEVGYISQWNDYHDKIYATLREEIICLKDSSISGSQLFTKISGIITKAMNHTLYELQELDILRFSDDTPCLNIDDICISILRDDDDAFLKRVYRFLEVRKFDSIIINQQTDVGLSNICRYSIDILKEQGISAVIV